MKEKFKKFVQAIDVPLTGTLCILIAVEIFTNVDIKGQIKELKQRVEVLEQQTIVENKDSVIEDTIQ